MGLGLDPLLSLAIPMFTALGIFRQWASGLAPDTEAAPDVDELAESGEPDSAPRLRE